MLCQQVTLLGDAEWPKVADAVIEAERSYHVSLRRDAPLPGLSGRPMVGVRAIGLIGLRSS